MKIFIETKRLILREFTKGDVANLLDLDSDPEVMRYVNGGQPTEENVIRKKHIPKILKYYREYKNLGFWAAVEKKSGEFMGWFHLKPCEGDASRIELGYRLKRKFWRQGYATEGSEALVRQCFRKANIRTVFAIALPENKASIGVMKKLGMQHETTFLHQIGREVVQYKIENPGGEK